MATYTSDSFIDIQASIEKVWEALVNPQIARQYFFGAFVQSDWTQGSTITFTGEYQGNKYLEKGIILNIEPKKQLQYTHWSSLENLPDLPENYRVWTFNLSKHAAQVRLSMREEKIPTLVQKTRSDEFWPGVLATIKKLLEE